MKEKRGPAREVEGDASDFPSVSRLIRITERREE